MALERITIALLVGGVLFQFVTGIFNSQVFYPWKFSFYEAHLYGAWVFIGAFVTHVALKLPTMVRVPPRAQPPGRAQEGPRRHRTRAARRLRVRGRATGPPHHLAPGSAGPGGGVVARFARAHRGPEHRWPVPPPGLFSPRGGSYGPGPNDFPVNKTAASTGIKPEETGPGWRLTIKGASGERSLTRDELMAMPQHTYDLPIACVEGWSVVATWTGVRIVDLASMVGAVGSDAVVVESLERGGAFARAALSGDQLRDEKSLLALRVTGPTSRWTTAFAPVSSSPPRRGCTTPSGCAR